MRDVREGGEGRKELALVFRINNSPDDTSLSEMESSGYIIASDKSGCTKALSRIYRAQFLGTGIYPQGASSPQEAAHCPCGLVERVATW